MSSRRASTRRSGADLSTPSSKRARVDVSLVDSSSPPSPTFNLEFHDVPHVSNEPTPLRKSRLQEQQDLQSLNQRLELYIMRVREKERNFSSAHADARVLRAEKAHELASLKEEYEQKLADLKANKSKQGQEVAKLKEQIEKLNNSLNLAEKEHSGTKKKFSDLTALYNSLKVELKEMSQRNNANENEIENLKKELDLNEIELKQQKEHHDAQQAQIATLQKQHTNLQNKYNTQVKEYEILAATHKSESAKAEKQINKLRAENSELEDSLRKEFGAQLKAIVSERQEQYEEEKNEAINELRSFYDEKLRETSSALAASQLSAENSFRQISDLQRELKEAHKKHAQLQTVNDGLEAQINTVQESVKAIKERHSEELNVKATQIKSYIAQLQSKDEAFQNLMDVKIALDAEIKSYRVMLEHEESRLGFTGTPAKPSLATSRLLAELDADLVSISSKKSKSTTKKRQSTSSSLFTSSITSVSTPARSQQFLQNSLSLSVSVLQHKIFVYNNAKESALGDDSESTVRLGGFSLRAVDSDVSFVFPHSVKLSAGSSVSVYTERTHAAANTDSSFYWAAEDQHVWTNGETVQLVDTNEQVIHQIKIKI